MSSSQDDIDALIDDVQSLIEEVEGSQEADAPPPLKSPTPAVPPAAPAPQAPPDRVTPELERILHLEVPVIVKLAERKMTLENTLKIVNGSIIEFNKPVGDSHLDLMVSNKCIGQGEAVKVGENFGLRITEIGSIEDKIKAMGGR